MSTCRQKPNQITLSAGVISADLTDFRVGGQTKIAVPPAPAFTDENYFLRFIRIVSRSAFSYESGPGVGYAHNSVFTDQSGQSTTGFSLSPVGSALVLGITNFGAQLEWGPAQFVQPVVLTLSDLISTGDVLVDWASSAQFEVTYTWQRYSNPQPATLRTPYLTPVSVDLNNLVQYYTGSLTGPKPTGFTLSSVNISDPFSKGQATLQGSVATFTPVVGFSGQASFIYSYEFPGYGTFCNVITVIVGEPPQPQYLPSNGRLITDFNTAASIDLYSLLIGVGIPPAPAPANLTVSTARSGTVTLAGSTATYTPNTGFSGSDQFTYSYVYPEDVGAPGPDVYVGRVDVQVRPCPAPVLRLSTDSRVTAYNTRLRFSVLATGASTAQVTVQPAAGTVSNISVSTDRITLDYRPNADFFGGSDSFQLQATSGCSTSSSITVPVSVGTPTPPVALGLSVTLEQGTSVNFELPVSGVINTVAPVTIVSAPAAGTVQLVSAPLGYAYTPNNSEFVGSDAFSYQVSGPGGNSSVAQVNLLVVGRRPSPVTFASLFNQASNAQVSTGPVTLAGNFAEDYTLTVRCVSDSAAPTSSSSALTAQYVQGLQRNRAGTVQTLGNSISVQQSDQVTALVLSAQALPDVTRTLTFSATVTGSALFPGYSNRTEFQVSTVPADTLPDPVDFLDQLNRQPLELVTTNTQTVTGITAGVPIAVTVLNAAGTVLVNGQDQGSSTTAVLQDQLAIRTLAPAEFVSERTVTVRLGSGNNSISDSFRVTTGLPRVTLPPWRFGDRTGLEPSTGYLTPRTVLFADLQTPVQLQVTAGASFVINGVNTGQSTVTVTSGQTVALLAQSAGTFSTELVYTVTLTAPGITASDEFRYTTRAVDLTPEFVPAFADQQDLQLTVPVTSNQVTVTDFDGSLPVLVSGSGVALSINGNIVGTAGTVVAGDVLQLSATSALTYYTTNSYTVTCGTGNTAASAVWNIRTKVYDDLFLTASF